MAKIISYICILLIATMAGPMIMNPPSALANIAMMQCNLHKSVGASSELVLQLSTNSDDVANFNTMFVCITEPYVSVSNKIKLTNIPASFISYVHSDFIKPSFDAKSGFNSWPCAAMFARKDLILYFVPQYSSRDICVTQTLINCRPTYLVSGYLDQSVMEIPKSLVNLLENLDTH